MIDNWRTQKVEQFLFAFDGLLFADIILSFYGEPAAIERKSINKSGLCIGTDVWFIDYYLYCDSLNYITLLCQVYYRCVCPWIDRTMETKSESIYMPRCCGLERLSIKSSGFVQWWSDEWEGGGDGRDEHYKHTNIDSGIQVLQIFRFRFEIGAPTCRRD